jgi:hypothetical protein
MPVAAGSAMRPLAGNVQNLLALREAHVMMENIAQ